MKSKRSSLINMILPRRTKITHCRKENTRDIIIDEEKPIYFSSYRHKGTSAEPVIGDARHSGVSIGAEADAPVRCTSQTRRTDSENRVPRTCQCSWEPARFCLRSNSRNQPNSNDHRHSGFGGIRSMPYGFQSVVSDSTSIQLNIQ